MPSKKRLDAIAGFEKVMNAVDTDEILEGTVVEVIKGGVLALTNGVKVFIPASQATLSRSDSLDDLLKQKVNFKILEVNRQRKRAVGLFALFCASSAKSLRTSSGKRSRSGAIIQASLNRSRATARLSTSAAWTAWFIFPS